ncbi:MAG TPA: vWA domain-containing protein [Xanthomonadales bacterium]|nr:vWA domain-containing protein [Xanthomonadales bacterium]
MRRPNRETSIFTTSAVDLFASALGAFILLVMILFPYYRNAGDDSAHARIQDILEQRNLAAGDLVELLASQERSKAELEQLNESNQGIEQRLSRQRTELKDLKTQLAEIPVARPVPVEEIIPEDAPLTSASVEFSILGLATNAKSFVLVIDMSGSMMAFSELMLESVLELLKPLDASNSLAIVGYQGEPSPVLWNYPDRSQLMQATPENLRQAREFVIGLSRRFAGSTPTHAALQAALEYKADAIILLSDGAPDTNPAYIIQEITSKNRFAGMEIHTVAIGDYTLDRALVMFLQTLAQQNGGDFVGVSR